MIFDHVVNRELYLLLDERFSRAFEYYLAFKPDTPAGRHELDGDDFFVLVQRPEKKPFEGAPLETHRKYVDLQIVVAGSELMGYAHRNRLAETVSPYNPDKDAELHADPGSARLHLGQGQFAVFWPQDGHKGACDDGSPEPLVKLCFKFKFYVPGLESAFPGLEEE